jgi:flagellar biosynthesis/type III secretory pathway chaperone
MVTAMNENTASQTWETHLAQLLNDLGETQTELLELLESKHEALVHADQEALAALAEPEQLLVERLQSCHDRRAELLASAAAEGMPSESLRALHASLDSPEAGELGPQIKDSVLRSRLLQHHSLTNWVITQRTLLHLSHILEIIATGGQMKPTYEKGESTNSSGSLVDRAA